MGVRWLCWSQQDSLRGSGTKFQTIDDAYEHISSLDPSKAWSRINQTGGSRRRDVNLTAQHYYDNILAPVLGPYPFSNEDIEENAGDDAADPPADIKVAPAIKKDNPTIGEILDNPGLYAMNPNDPDYAAAQGDPIN
eukprot:gene16070-22207_t